MKISRPAQCAAIIQPGEFTIDIWDNTRCPENRKDWLLRCPGCNALYCADHYHAHLRSVTIEHFEAATS